MNHDCLLHSRVDVYVEAGRSQRFARLSVHYLGLRTKYAHTHAPPNLQRHCGRALQSRCRDPPRRLIPCLSKLTVSTAGVTAARSIRQLRFSMLQANTAWRNASVMELVDSEDESWINQPKFTLNDSDSESDELDSRIGVAYLEAVAAMKQVNSVVAAVKCKMIAG